MANRLGYRGDTYRIPCDTGGWNANPNTDAISPENMVNAININMHKGGRGTRGGVARVNSTQITGGVEVTGGAQFRLTNGNEFIVNTTADGRILRDYNTNLLTGWANNRYGLLETFRDNLYICNGANRPQVWNGVAATTSNLANVPADWTGVNFPKHMIVHGRGVSESLWAYGCPTTPRRIYVSANGTDNFSDASVTMLNIETGDGFGIVGAVEFGDRFICFGRNKAYIIDDASPTRSNWGYVQAQWSGGAAHERAICRTPNDLIVFDENLSVYSVATVQEYGDYEAISLTRPAYINAWIDQNVDLAQINKFHIIYDSELRAIKLFVVRNGRTRVDTALVYFIDKPPDKAWVRHSYASDNFASCSFPVRVNIGNWKIYTGGHNGFVYQMEAATFNDDGLQYYNGFTTPHLTFDNARLRKQYDFGWLVLIPQSTETVRIRLNIDGLPNLGMFQISDEIGNILVDETGTPIFGVIEEVYAVTVSPSGMVQNLPYRIGSIGTRLQVEVFNDTINTSFLVSQKLFDFEYLEARL